MLEIAARGHTPEHAHENEHENFVLDGSGEVLCDGEFHPVGPGERRVHPGVGCPPVQELG